MPLFKRSFPVKCKVEDAFEYVADWKNLLDFMPMLLDTKPTSLVSYGPGTTLDSTVVLAKMEVPTSFDLVEFVKNKRIMYKSMRGIRSKLSWDFSQGEGKMLVTLTFEYEIPPGIVTKGSELEAIEKDMQERANQSTELLKWVLESRTFPDKEED
jgi:ribosome-associated toxin RatA of RatAB toxin-antitoxin module